MTSPAMPPVVTQAGEGLGVAADTAAHRVVNKASDNLGAWMSAALDDPAVCDAMKADIRAWFDAGQPTPRSGEKYASPLERAQVANLHKDEGAASILAEFEKLRADSAGKSESVFTITVGNYGSSLHTSKAASHSFINAIGSAMEALVSELRDYTESPHFANASPDERCTADVLLFFFDTDEDESVRDRYRALRVSK